MYVTSALVNSRGLDDAGGRSWSWRAVERRRIQDQVAPGIGFSLSVAQQNGRSAAIKLISLRLWDPILPQQTAEYLWHFISYFVCFWSAFGRRVTSIRAQHLASAISLATGALLSIINYSSIRSWSSRLVDSGVFALVYSDFICVFIGGDCWGECVGEVSPLSSKMPVRRGHVALQNTYLDTIIRKFDEQSEWN